MSTLFQIDEEIDRLVEKFSEQLRDKIKKAVIRSEKIVLKQYIASQKETGKPATKDKEHYSSTSRKVPSTPERKRTTGRRMPKREQDYAYASSSDSD
jgi:hypothetical protein